MLTKEKCEKVVGRLYQNGYVNLIDCDIVAELIKEHFELVEKYNTLLTRSNALSQPYKFEDLKECDYVYDKKEKEIILIIEIFENRKTNEKFIRALVFGYKDFIEIPFEENRLYPVYIAK